MIELEDADLTLVEIKDNHAYCKKHGAMNSVARYMKDGKKHLVWRCVTTYKYMDNDKHLPPERRRMNWNPCRAGCVTILLSEEETKKKISETEKGKTGYHRTAEHREKMSKAKKGTPTGEDHWSWKGGRKISRKRNVVLNGVRTSTKYKKWRKAIMDATFPNGVPKGLKVNVHHMKPLSTILKENNITTVEQAMECDAVWDLDNGVAITKGEHYLISLMERYKRNSKGFFVLLKQYIEENKERAIPISDFEPK